MYIYIDNPPLPPYYIGKIIMKTSIANDDDNDDIQCVFLFCLGKKLTKILTSNKSDKNDDHPVIYFIVKKEWLKKTII